MTDSNITPLPVALGIEGLDDKSLALLTDVAAVTEERRAQVGKNPDNLVFFRAMQPQQYQIYGNIYRNAQLSDGTLVTIYEDGVIYANRRVENGPLVLGERRLDDYECAHLAQNIHHFANAEELANFLKGFDLPREALDAESSVY